MYFGGGITLKTGAVRLQYYVVEVLNKLYIFFVSTYVHRKHPDPIQTDMFTHTQVNDGTERGTNPQPLA
jgi:hypothetical protein